MNILLINGSPKGKASNSLRLAKRASPSSTPMKT